eukprot:2371126-Ditylum_brightwellii.AAC.1
MATAMSAVATKSPSAGVSAELIWPKDFALDLLVKRLCSFDVTQKLANAMYMGDAVGDSMAHTFKQHRELFIATAQ